MSDLVTFGETMLRLSPPSGERLEVARDIELRAAGAESNTAIAADRLGATATWLSRLPDTPLGRRVASGVHQHGVDTQIVWSQDPADRQGTYFLEHAGQPRGTNVIYDREDSAVSKATPDEFDLDAIRDARAFFTTGITPALSTTLKKTTASLMEVARKSGTIVAFDVNYRAKLWSREEARQTLTQFFPAIDVLIVAARDAREVFGIDGEGPQIAHTIASEFDFKTVVITQGEHGAVAWHDSVVHEHDAYDTDTVDPIGTGDAFTGAFLARRLSGDDVHRSLEYAAATAALKRTIPGDVATVTKSEVESVVAENVDGISR